jgi:hypothetical protein
MAHAWLPSGAEDHNVALLAVKVANAVLTEHPPKALVNIEKLSEPHW